MLVGRKEETRVLREAAASSQAELVAVYGRRRVGKTFLIREVYAGQIVFELVGTHEGKMSRQLQAFAQALQVMEDAPMAFAAPADWMSALQTLSRALEPRLKRARNKLVVFFDELPWLATRRSGFLEAFEHFWNAWASRHNKLVVVICGSAASWMLRKVVRQRGGLHNRVTRRLRLDPFMLEEVEELLAPQGTASDRYQILQLYMALGGVPHYLAQVRRGESAAQAIDRLCFSREGPLRDEFDLLYPALFRKPERHEAVVRTLAKRRGGWSRGELVAELEMSDGGGLTKVLHELEESGFITITPQLGKTVRDSLYRLSDPYSLFYLRFIEGHRGGGKGSWLKKQRSPAYRAWSGLTFEAVALAHVEGIKRSLGIDGIETEEASWHHRGADGDEGAQIDLVIDRADRAISLCEMKFAEDSFVIDKRYAEDLRRKLRVFVAHTGTRKSPFLVLVTTYGVRDNAHSRALGVTSVTMDALFSARGRSW